MKNLKIQALANFLGIEIEEIEEGYGDSLFEVGKEEYLVLTDDEVDTHAKENILDSLWAFNPDFIQAHSGLNDKAIKALHKAQVELCEDANDLVKGVIKDLDHFVNDAIRCDGRGHFLNTYDGAEECEKVENTWFYIYRTN